MVHLEEKYFTEFRFLVVVKSLRNLKYSVDGCQTDYRWLCVTDSATFDVNKI